MTDLYDDDEEWISKTQRKRECDALQHLGEELITLKNSELDSFQLPDDLYDAIQAAKKIVGREIELDRNTIVDIISNKLKSVAQHKCVTIYVNQSDLTLLDKNRPRLKEVLENVEALSVQAREDVETGGCIIETEGGIINNASLEAQWRALETAFQALMKK